MVYIIAAGERNSWREGYIYICNYEIVIIENIYIYNINRNHI